MSTSPRRTRSASARNNNNNNNPPASLRRSTRQAALDANIRIVESQQHCRLKRDPIAPVIAKDQSPPGRILLDSPDKAASLSDFICPICLDCPSSLSQLATISGCTHRFCWGCIDTWAGTENTCPCCKARFSRIDRVEPIRDAGVDDEPRRRSKRKRNSSNSSSRRRISEPPINSRTIPNRNQQSIPTLNVAFIEQILQYFTNAANDRGGNFMTGVFSNGGHSFQFSNVGGNPVMRIERQVQGGDGDGGGDGVVQPQPMELFLAEREGEGGRPGRGRVRLANAGDVFPPLPVGVGRGGEGGGVGGAVGGNIGAAAALTLGRVGTLSRRGDNSDTTGDGADQSPRSSALERVQRLRQRVTEMAEREEALANMRIQGLSQRQRALAAASAAGGGNEPATRQSPSNAADSPVPYPTLGTGAGAAAGGTSANQAETTTRRSPRLRGGAPSLRDGWRPRPASTERSVLESLAIANQAETTTRRNPRLNRGGAPSLRDSYRVAARERAAAGGTPVLSVLDTLPRDDQAETTGRSPFTFGAGAASMRASSGPTITIRPLPVMTIRNHPSAAEAEAAFAADSSARNTNPYSEFAARSMPRPTNDWSSYSNGPQVDRTARRTSRQSAGNSPAPARGGRSRAPTQQNNAASSPPRRSSRLASSSK